MKSKKFRRIAIAACALCMAVPMMTTSLAACSNEDDDKPGVVDPVATVTSITLNTDNVKKSFAYGEQFSVAGLVVTGNMSDGTTQTIELKDLNITSPNMKSPGPKTITVTYRNVKATYEINIADRIMPTINATSILDIEGENPNDSFRVEAEALDYETPGVKVVEGKQLINDLDVEEGKYLSNYGVVGNYFGFTFTAEHEYTNANIVFRIANPTTKTLGLGTNMNVYLNYKDYTDMGTLDIKDLTVLPAGKLPETSAQDGEATDPATPEVELQWEDRILRNVTIPKGTNTLTFEVLGEDVVAIDYVELYIGKLYGSNNATVLDKAGMVIKDVEDFDLEKIVVRSDIKNHYGLQDGQAFVENAGVNGANTHGGRSVGAMVAPTELTTVIRVEEKATVHILYTIASVGGYDLKDNYEFYLDGEKVDVEDYFVKAGDYGKQNQFWEWRDVSLGYHDLEAGDHLFSVKVVKADCNCDCFKFDVVSYGEFVKHPTANAKINIREHGTYVFEAENADSFYKDENGEVKARIVTRPDFVGSAVMGEGYYRIADRADCSGGRFIYGATTGSQFVYTLYAWENTTLDINMRAVRTDEGETLVKDAVSIKLNDQAVAIKEASQNIDLQGENWQTVTLAEGVKLNKGELYTFTMEMTGNYFDLDCINFVTTEYKGEVPVFGGIELDTANVKKEYEVGDEFTTEGLKVTAVQTNGVRKEVDLADCTITGGDTSAYGDKTITISYTEGGVTKTATYDIKVYAAATSITLDTSKAKTSYSYGETLNTDGLIVTANLEDGTTRNVNLESCTITGSLENIGENTITVSYLGHTATYVATVRVDASLTAEGATVQAEDLDLSRIIKDAGAYTENWAANGQSGVSLRGIQKGSILSFSVSVEEDITLNFKGVMSKYEALDVSTMFTLTIDGKTITVPSVVLGRAEDGSNDWFNWKDIDFGNIELTAGAHVIELNFINNGPNIDCFVFSAVQA